MVWSRENIQVTGDGGTNFTRIISEHIGILNGVDLVPMIDEAADHCHSRVWRAVEGWLLAIRVIVLCNRVNQACGATRSVCKDEAFTRSPRESRVESNRKVPSLIGQP